MSEFFEAARGVAAVLQRTLDAHGSFTQRFLAEIVERRVNEILDLFAAEVEASRVTASLLLDADPGVEEPEPGSWLAGFQARMRDR